MIMFTEFLLGEGKHGVERSIVLTEPRPASESSVGGSVHGQGHRDRLRDPVAVWTERSPQVPCVQLPHQ